MLCLLTLMGYNTYLVFMQMLLVCSKNQCPIKAVNWIPFAQCCLAALLIVICLQACSVGSSATIAIVLPNGPEMGVCVLGCLACTTCAPLNANLTEDELLGNIQVLNRCCPSTICSHPYTLLCAGCIDLQGTFTIYFACAAGPWRSGGNCPGRLCSSSSTCKGRAAHSGAAPRQACLWAFQPQIPWPCTTC